MTWHTLVLDVYERRLGSRRAAQSFLAGGAPPDPGDLPQLEAATKRIERALRDGETIAIFGHDDADGITSAAVLTEALEQLGGRVVPYVPDRNVEGHGLYPDLVRRFRDSGATLLVTTDGCSGNAEEVALAASIGLDVWVTDHHEITDVGRAPSRLVNPKADPETSRLRGDLTGAGVAALLAQDLLERAGHSKSSWHRLWDLVALGTIADYGDLARSNRTFVTHGLAAIERWERTALREVASALGIGGERVRITAQTRRLATAFAALPSRDGRSRGLDALLGRASMPADVRALLDAFGAVETERDAVVARACAEAQRIGALAGAPTVVVLEQATPRTLGASATELVTRTSRPAAVLFKGDKLIGELRAPEGVHLVDVLNGLRGSLESWGGHRQAAGFSAHPRDTDAIVRGLTDAFRAVAAASLAPPAAVITMQRAEIDARFRRSLRAAAPFGKGNEAPFFRVDGELRSAEDLLTEAEADS